MVFLFHDRIPDPQHIVVDSIADTRGIPVVLVVPRLEHLSSPAVEDDEFLEGHILEVPDEEYVIVRIPIRREDVGDDDMAFAIIETHNNGIGGMASVPVLAFAVFGPDWQLAVLAGAFCALGGALTEILLRQRRS